MPLAVVIVGITHWHAPRYMQMLAARGARLVGASDEDAIAGAAVAEQAGIESNPVAVVQRMAHSGSTQRCVGLDWCIQYQSIAAHYSGAT